MPRSPDLLCIISLEQGCFTQLNANWSVVLNYSQEELQFQPYLDLIHPQDQGLTAAALAQLCGTTETVYLQNRCRSADGNYRFVQWTASCLGSQCSVYAVIREIPPPASPNSPTQETLARTRLSPDQAQAALEQIEAKYRSIFENALDGIYQTSPEGYYISANPALARLYGYESPAELIDALSSIEQQLYVQPQRRQEFRTLVERDGVVSNFESQVYQRDGSVIWISENARAVRDAKGTVLYYEGIVENITERKAVERLKNEFISTVSHELRTPLTSIRGALGLLINGVAGDLSPQIRALVDMAYKNSERLVLLINDILDIEKIEAGRMHFDLQPLNLISLIEQALEVNRPYGEQLQVQFLLEPCVPEIMVQADSNRVIQVLTNLLSNAAKFSPAQGTVKVTVSQQEQWVQVAIADRGPGIPVEFRTRIFQKFAQADGSDQRRLAGTGLGLSISKAIAEKLGGEISFETEINVGTTFYFKLPLWQAIAKPTPTTPASEIRILICEDNPDIAKLLSLMLQQAGFTTDQAGNAAQAKQFLQQYNYAAMTVDLMLPDQDGISLIRELRNQPDTQNLPIVVVSAKAQQGRQELQEAGFAVMELLDKPIDQGELLSVVARAIHRPIHHPPRILHIEDQPDLVELVR